ncbi:hypothetical protein AMTRI_Chr13g91740 [Amborella trichopoda]|uniref:Dof zinc finger protein n=1 Tax=Amborella trichopoda TaxID=13333 RepID=U5D5I8_AMBTC|nr:dof zinc finger protein DOF1.7 [Amborella trichopoda]ERN17704.1 hypothetical protein AMTR_s00059p00213350 [Amborella trichopoda]|eukprot:XP_006856237.1 dof zinc finger protein DOF1.7 [Amborella trichopoda]
MDIHHQHQQQNQVTKPQPLDQPHEHLRCPRCDSTNTKFCYYNNYNLSQPRHFCKNCRRYWTKGGALRNIPIGGATRKTTKRSSSKPKPPSKSVILPEMTPSMPEISATTAADMFETSGEITGTFSSLLAANGGFGGLGEPWWNGGFQRVGGFEEGGLMQGSFVRGGIGSLQEWLGGGICEPWMVETEGLDANCWSAGSGLQ